MDVNFLFEFFWFILIPSKLVHFISAGKCKKSEMLYIAWLNIVGVIPFIAVEKSKMYWQGVKSTASGLTLYT